MACDLRCTSWGSDDPTVCDCRDTAGKTRHHADERLEARHDAEQAWHSMTLCERAAELDTIAAKGA